MIKTHRAAVAKTSLPPPGRGRTLPAVTPARAKEPVKRRDNEMGEFVGGALSGLYKMATLASGLLPAAAHSTPSSDTGDLKAKASMAMTGPAYAMLTQMLKWPVSQYDTKAIMAERRRQVELQHEILVSGGQYSTIDIHTPERDKLRDQIVDALYANGAAHKEHQAWILVAVPAAGKSTLSGPLAKEQGAVDIDSDGALDFLPEWQKNHVSFQVDAERSALEQRIQDRAMEHGDNLILNMVPRTNTSHVERALQQLKDHGYQTHLVYLDIPIQKAIERSLSRFATTGRYNDPFVEMLLKDGPRNAYEKLKHSPLVADYAIYSTDVPKGAAPILEEQGANPS